MTSTIHGVGDLPFIHLSRAQPLVRDGVIANLEPVFFFFLVLRCRNEPKHWYMEIAV